MGYPHRTPINKHAFPALRLPHQSEPIPDNIPPLITDVTLKLLLIGDSGELDSIQSQYDPVKPAISQVSGNHVCYSASVMMHGRRRLSRPLVSTSRLGL